MKKTRKLLSITIVLGILVSMLSGFSVMADAGEITAFYDAQQSTDAQAVITFSEAIADSNGIKLYDTETLEVVSVAAEKLSDLSYGFALAGLKKGAEYVIKVPAGIAGTVGTNVTTADEIYFNVADDAVITGKAGESAGVDILFEDDFSSYTTQSDASSGTQNVTNVTNPKWKFTHPGGMWSGRGAYAYSSNGNKVLKIDNWQLASNDQTKASTIIGGEAIKTGITEFTFDAAVQNPDANVTGNKKNRFVVGLDGGDTVNHSWPYYVIEVDTKAINAFHNIEYTDTKTTAVLENPNNLTDFNSYKIVADFELGTVSSYVKNGTDYALIYNAPMPDAIKTNGITGISFIMLKENGDGTLASGTSALVDNVKVCQEGKVVPYDFEDDFSSYTTQGDASGGTGNVANVTNPKWKFNCTGSTWWGRGAYAYSLDGNKVLKIDNWQNADKIDTRASTIIGGEAIKTGITEFTFDAAVQNPVANVEGNKKNRFVVGLDGGDTVNHNWPYYVIEVDTKAINAFHDIEYTDTKTTAVCENPNNLTDFNSYKIVADFELGTVSSYVKNGTDYALIYNAPMPDAIKTNGITGISFIMLKENLGATLASNTSALIDNVKVDIMKKDIVPVVERVRIDEAAASDAVAVNAQEIKIYFNKPMKADTLTAITVGGVAIPGVYSNTDYSYTITLSEDLTPLTDYIIAVPASVKDASESANPVRAYSGKFRTAKGIFKVDSFYLKEGTADATLAGTAVGDTLKAGVSITNSAQNVGEYVLIYAIYDGDMLKKIDYVKVPFSESTPTVEKDIDFTIPQTTGQLGVKIMLWESFKTLIPIEHAITLN